MKVLLAGLDDDVGAHVGPLTTAGWHVVSATDAATALMAARRETPEVVVVAATLPGGRGHGLIERLRHLAPSAMVPVVGLATDAEPAAALTAAGADRCLPADVDAVGLLDTLADLTGGPAAAGGAPAVQVTGHPASRPDSATRPVRGPPSPPGTGRVLLIEDEDSLRTMLVEALELEGHEVAALPSAEQVLDACRADPPDVVLLDVMLPGMSGLDLLFLLKGDPALHHLPVLLVSARDDEAVVEGLRRGAHDYVRKPFDLGELLARVDGALAIKRTQDELAGYAMELESSARVDPSTGVDNRRSCEVHLERMTDQASRTQRPLSALLVEIVPDAEPEAAAAAGAPATERFAMAVADRLVSTCRTADVPARWRRDQFVVLLPNTDRAGARVAARRVSEALLAGTPGAVGATASASLSVGLATLEDGPGQLLSDAEASLAAARDHDRAWTVQLADASGPEARPCLVAAVAGQGRSGSGSVVEPIDRDGVSRATGW